MNKLLFFTFIILIFFINCQGKNVASNVQLTLASIKKIGQTPLYQMTYYGDYGLNDFLINLPINNKGSKQDSQYQDAYACSCFYAEHQKGGYLFGRNFDWDRHPMLILFTDSSDGYASVTMVDISYLGVERTSTLTEELKRQLLRAPYLPFDGMNEKGLVVGMMAVNQANRNYNPQLPTVDSLEIIRIVLDYAASVEEAIDFFNQYNIDFNSGPPLHYMIADRQGNSVIVEFYDGELKLINPVESWQASTNFIFSQFTDDNEAGCWRYEKLTSLLDKNQGVLSPQQAMELLEAVDQSSTIWSTVYEISTKKISLVIDRNFQQVYQFQLE
ncbi:MAG: linear amide C-N hydrolase [Spirochaetes bacterium]|nr:linear amide C-N hydrolase [Spirochaetota bacterium]